MSFRNYELNARIIKLDNIKPHYFIAKPNLITSYLKCIKDNLDAETVIKLFRNHHFIYHDMPRFNWNKSLITLHTGVNNNNILSVNGPCITSNHC